MDSIKSHLLYTFCTPYRMIIYDKIPKEWKSNIMNKYCKFLSEKCKNTLCCICFKMKAVIDDISEIDDIDDNNIYNIDPIIDNPGIVLKKHIEETELDYSTELDPLLNNYIIINDEESPNNIPI